MAHAYTPGLKVTDRLRHRMRRVLPIAGDLIPSHPNLEIFAISESTDGQLILSAMRRGFREFITKPIDTVMLAEAVEKIAQQSEDGTSEGKLISLLGSAGGVGTTAIATNLSVELKSICSGNVTVVDLDYRFGQVATFLDVSPTYTIADLAQSTEELESEIIDRTLVDLVDRVLDRGCVIEGELWLTVAGIDLVYLGLKAVLTTPDRLLRGEA